jgi:hypothetical protein
MGRPETVARFTSETYELPTIWASYFVNADASGLDDEEQAAADAWWADNFGALTVSCSDISEESWFAWRHDADAFSLAGDVASFSFLIHQR